jgi:hypothetical protein
MRLCDRPISLTSFPISYIVPANVPGAKNLHIQVIFAVKVLLDSFIGPICVSYNDGQSFFDDPIQPYPDRRT